MSKKDPEKESFGLSKDKDYSTAGGKGDHHTMESLAPQVPPDYKIRVIVAILFFWPLGALAYFRSLKIHERYQLGDYEGALQASNETKFWANMGIIIGAILCTFALVVLIVVYSVFD